MSWIRAQDGNLYNLDHILSLRVEGGDKGGESVDILVARLADGQEVELGHSPWGVHVDALADAIRNRLPLVDVIRDEVIEEGSANDDEEVVRA